MKTYNIAKILNHNVVVCRSDEDSREYIVFGKGIGFQKKENDIVPVEQIQNVYELVDLKDRRRYEELLNSADDEVVEVTEEVISEMTNSFGAYDKRIHLALLDHIQFSVKRYREKITVKNVFTDEIQFLYPKEFQFAKEVLAKINERLKINLDNSEIGFICMHIHAALQGESASLSTMIAQILTETLAIIEREMQINLNDYEVAKQRLVTHLKFAIKRSLDGVEINNLIGDLVHDKYRKSYQIACMIGDHIENTYGINIGEGERCYLTIHLQNIVMYRK